jgi:SAM-dependent methyltransferase
MVTSDERHWDAIYRNPSEDLGWYEPQPSTLRLVTMHSSPNDAVIDIGGGDSRLVDNLLDLGYEDVTVLDLSTVVLDRARRRLGQRAKRVQWIQADVTRFEPDRTWNLWHDRAVFHFLVDDVRRDAYREVLGRALAPGGVLVIAAFGHAAPDRCAGLPVAHYDASTLPAAFAPDFEPLFIGDLDPARADEGDQRPYVGGAFTRNAVM